MLIVEPVADPLAQLFPIVLVLEHALAAATIELGDAERFDLRLAVEAELLLDLDLDRQPVRVPSRLARHVKSLRRKVSEAGGNPALIETVRGVGYRVTDEPPESQ